MVKIFLVCLFLLMNGCSSTTTPIYNPPPIQLPPDPILATDYLTKKSTPDEVVKAWVATAVAYSGWVAAVKKQMKNSR